jgi:thioesterase domain-containing protein
MRAYRGEPIDAPVILFRALTPIDYAATGLMELKEYDLDPSYGWADLVKRPVEIHALRGNHASVMVGEQLPATAARIQLCLKRIREEFTV